MEHMMEAWSIKSSILPYGFGASEVKKRQTESRVPCLWRCPLVMVGSAQGQQLQNPGQAASAASFLSHLKLFWSLPLYQVDTLQPLANSGSPNSLWRNSCFLCKITRVSFFFSPPRVFTGTSPILIPHSINSIYRLIYTAFVKKEKKKRKGKGKNTSKYPDTKDFVIVATVVSGATFKEFMITINCKINNIATHLKIYILLAKGLFQSNKTETEHKEKHISNCFSLIDERNFIGISNLSLGFCVKNILWKISFF